MRSWMIETSICTEEQLDELERESKALIRNIQKQAWNDYLAVFEREKKEALGFLDTFEQPEIIALAQKLKSNAEANLRDIYETVRKSLRLSRHQPSDLRNRLLSWYDENLEVNDDRFHSKLFTDGTLAAKHIKRQDPVFEGEAKMVDGREVLNACFAANFERDATLLAFGEDVGAIGDVNQGFAGLQQKFGADRIFDTGIRENTIVGQGIGLAMRGLRPIAEIQYLDYLLYAISTLSDDLATLSYRTKGTQKAPLIVRTRGHRLEGIWHSGSPMAMILGSLRGMHICVPRDMTQAAGMYNTLFRSDEPALVIESLNGYRLKERLPDNVGEFTVPLGEAEVLKSGTDITIVSYGSTLRVVREAVEELEQLGISVEIVDPQTLQPFDIHGVCGQSLSKTNRLLVVDEDLPGGAAAFITQHILEEQKGYFHLDGQPRTLTARAHRPPYGSDGDYFTKPSVDDVIETVYAMMHEAKPDQYPPIY
jgi:pyruvate/2-oxoglutarate/acetoin dehydrogenase E1 component